MKQSERQQVAVALTYHNGNTLAPLVAAKGYGLTAEAIIARARAAGIYVHESPTLVALLMQIDLDARIPEQLYTAVAELLAWLYHLEHGGDSPQSPMENTIFDRS